MDATTGERDERRDDVERLGDEKYMNEGVTAREGEGEDGRTGEGEMRAGGRTKGRARLASERASVRRCAASDEILEARPELRRFCA